MYLFNVKAFDKLLLVLKNRVYDIFDYIPTW